MKKKLYTPAGILGTLFGGPFHGMIARLSKGAWERTITFTAKGMTGCYIQRHWSPINTEEKITCHAEK